MSQTRAQLVKGLSNTSASDDAVTVDSSGRLLINNSSSSNGRVVIEDTSFQVSLETGTAGDGRLQIGHFAAGAFIGTYGDDGGAADIIRFGTHSGDERMRILSAGGLTFNGDTAQTNALDDYEEGTFTPRVYFGTTTEIGTFNNQSSAEYVRVGKIVHVSGFSRYDSIDTSNSGIVTLALPLAVDEHGQPHNFVYPGSCAFSHTDLQEKGIFVWCGNAGGALTRFGFYNSSSGSLDYIENGDLSGWNGNTRYIHFNFTYQTSA